MDGVPFWKLYRCAGLHLRKKLRYYIDADFRGKSIFRIRFDLLSLYVSLCHDQIFQISTFRNRIQSECVSIWISTVHDTVVIILVEYAHVVWKIDQVGLLSVISLFFSCQIFVFLICISEINGFEERISGWNRENAQLDHNLYALIEGANKQSLPSNFYPSKDHLRVFSPRQRARRIKPRNELIGQRRQIKGDSRFSAETGTK